MEERCPACGAHVVATQYVCGYCRAVLSDRIRKVGGGSGPGPGGARSESFEELVGVVQNNLDAVHAIPRPTAGAILLATLRVFAIIYTLGIVLVWWKKKPAAAFDHASFENLAAVITRNVGLLRARASGSPELIAQVDVLERELKAARERARRVRLMQWGIPIGITLALLVVGALAPDEPR